MTRRDFGKTVLISPAAITLGADDAGIEERRVYSTPAQAAAVARNFPDSKVTGNTIWIPHPSLAARAQAWDRVNGSADWQKFVQANAMELREISLRPL